ncbi:hypothetical protein H4R35_003490 [Dimargaris xerosporica]|nr:hypothetical protein H4R35_003490 [Dimargaris xerosporica]
MLTISRAESPDVQRLSPVGNAHGFNLFLEPILGLPLTSPLCPAANHLPCFAITRCSREPRGTLPFLPFPLRTFWATAHPSTCTCCCWHKMDNWKKASSFVSDRLSTLSGSTANSTPRFTSNAELFDYVTTRIIYQAGVDFESKPMLVFCACNFLSTRDVDYDKVLIMILNKLDEFVENDYTVVLFASGAKHRPGWTWLFKAYRSLSRKYKKNLKNLYVVHPSTWARVLMDMMNVVISPKFFKKLNWVDKLSDLAHHVPLDQITVPPEVQEYNDTLEPRAAVTAAINAGQKGGSHTARSTSELGEVGLIFGVPLIELLGPNAEHGLPQVVTDCIQYIEDHGLDTEGIFRRSPHSHQLQEAKRAYNTGNRANLDDYGVHVAAVLLKMYFRELPTPLIPHLLYADASAMIDCDTDSKRVTHIQANLLPRLDPPSRFALAHIIYLMHRISLNSQVNKMTSHNLAVVWTPNLAKSDNLRMDLQMYDPNNGGSVGMVVRVAIDHYQQLFVDDAQN